MGFPFATLEALSASVYLDLLRDRTLNMSYSQLGEDIIILHLLMNNVRKPHGGFYVDIGAFHPRELSNTRLLNFLGWRGLNVDASEESIAAFTAERPNDINVCTGVGQTEGQSTYYRFAGGAASTFSEKVAETWKEKHGWNVVETRTLNIKPINDLLKEHLPEGQEIDYMNIDVEGLDRLLVDSLNFDLYKPSIISVELHDADTMNLGVDRTVQRLASNGYKLMSINLVTYIFMQTQFVV
jgi:hypothetical protein